jgi:hypothetical protein
MKLVEITLSGDLGEYTWDSPDGRLNLLWMSPLALDDGYFNNLIVEQTLTVDSVDAKYLSTKGGKIHYAKYKSDIEILDDDNIVISWTQE